MGRLGIVGGGWRWLGEDGDGWGRTGMVGEDGDGWGRMGMVGEEGEGQLSHNISQDLQFMARKSVNQYFSQSVSPTD